MLHFALKYLSLHENAHINFENMIQRIKNYVLHLACVLALLGGMTACDGFEINWGGGNGNGNGSGNGNGGTEEVIELAGCWHLVNLNATDVDVDIYIDFGKDGKFAIYQRTETLEFTVFNGTYTNDEENAVISGVYDDGTEWLCDYNYVVDKEAKTLSLTNVENVSEVAVYEWATLPASATVQSRCASVNDVKPL